MKPRLPRSLLALLIFLALASSACMAVTGAATTREPAAAPKEVLEATKESLEATKGLLGAVPTSTQALVATAAPAQPEPTSTTAAAEPTVTAIPAKTTAPTSAPAYTLPAGLEVFRHNEIPGFVFPADPNRWQLDASSENPWFFLVARNTPDCEIRAVPGRGIGTPDRLLRWQLGRLFWTVLDYGNSALVSIDQPGQLFLELHGFSSAQCRADQQAVMERVMLEDERNGKLAYALLPTPTQRPALAGFSCPNTPPTRLRVGDYAYIVTNDLLLRSEPRASDDTRIRTYDATDPVSVMILEGPVCTEKFVYWKVSIGIIGEGVPEPETGWMAEGDLREYFLEPGR